MRQGNTSRTEGRDITDIFKKPRTERTVKEPVITERAPVPLGVRKEPERIDPMQAAEQFSHAVDVCNRIIGKIDERCQGLEVEVDLEKYPELEIHLMNLFGEKKTKLTYADYVKMTERLQQIEEFSMAERFGF